MGLEPRILVGTQHKEGPERLRLNSFFQEAANPAFLASIQRVNDRAESAPQSLCEPRSCYVAVRIDVYSAAATNAGFLLAADSMKSEMRGTISDLKREPLKTP